MSKRISELTALTTVAENDLLPVVDVSASETKKVTKQDLLKEIQQEVDDNTDAQHTHSNKAVLDGITNAGSGQIITSGERSKLAGIEDNAEQNDVWVEVVPTGVVDGSNNVFTLPDTPVAGSLFLFWNGQFQRPGGSDYTLTGDTITFQFNPEGSLFAKYQKAA